MAANWPQWRGPSGLGVSAESNLPTTWSGRENIAWSAALGGLGSSSPIVWGDQIFVTSQAGRLPLSGASHPALARDDAALVSLEKPIGGQRHAPSDAPDPIVFVVESFNRSDGRRVWEHRVAARGPFPNLHEKHNLATPTPVTNGEQVFAWFGTGQLVALDMRGQVVWSKHLGEEYSPFDINWGHGSSPALYRDLVILLCDHASASYVIALDARTGKLRWKADRGKGRASYSTPLVVPGPNGDELIVNSSERIDALRSSQRRAAVVCRRPAPDASPVGGLSRWPDLPDTRLSEQSVSRDPTGRAGRCQLEPCRVARARRRLVCRVARRVRRVALHDQRCRSVDLRGHEDRRAGLADTSRRRLLCVAGRGRRQDLFLQSDRRDDRRQSGARPGDPGAERSRREAGRVARDLGRTDLPAQ